MNTEENTWYLGDVLLKKVLRQSIFVMCAEGILASSVHVNSCGGSAFYVVLVHTLYANGCPTGKKAVSNAHRNAAQKPESACLI